MVSLGRAGSLLWGTSAHPPANPIARRARAQMIYFYKASYRVTHGTRPFGKGSQVPAFGLLPRAPIGRRLPGRGGGGFLSAWWRSCRREGSPHRSGSISVERSLSEPVGHRVRVKPSRAADLFRRHSAHDESMKSPSADVKRCSHLRIRAMAGEDGSPNRKDCAAVCGLDGAGKHLRFSYVLSTVSVRDGLAVKDNKNNIGLSDPTPTAVGTNADLRLHSRSV